MLFKAIVMIHMERSPILAQTIGKEQTDRDTQDVNTIRMLV